MDNTSLTTARRSLLRSSKEVSPAAFRGAEVTLLAIEEEGGPKSFQSQEDMDQWVNESAKSYNIDQNDIQSGLSLLTQKGWVNQTQDRGRITLSV